MSAMGSRGAPSVVTGMSAQTVFVREYLRGAKDAAAAIYGSEDPKCLAKKILVAAGERNAQDLLETLGLERRR